MENKTEQGPYPKDFKFEFKLDPKISAPEFKPVRHKEWVPYIDPDGGQYPDYILDLFNNSALHGAIVRSKIQQVSGNGFMIDPSAENAEAALSFMGDINDNMEDINEVLWKVSEDLEIFGGFALKVTWSNDWSRIASVKHLDFSKVRARKITDIDGIEGYYFCWDWDNQKSEKFYLPKFSEKSALDGKRRWKEAMDEYKEARDEKALEFLKKEQYSQILYYKAYAPNQIYYPFPSYIGAVPAIETDIQSDQYGIASFNNGLNTNIMVTFFDITTEERKVTTAKQFLEMHTGASQSQKPIIAFADNANDAPKVENIGGSKEDKVFTSINENTLQKILSGHRVTDPVLVGIKTPGELGNSDLGLAIDFWNNTVIIPEQQKITKVFNKFMSINGFPELEIDPFVFIDQADQEEQEESPNETNTEISDENENGEDDQEME